MFFSIDPSNGVAIYDQIVRRVKFAIADGVLVPGQLLRSVRALAVRLAINPNTIAKAFLQLQNEGVVEALRGRGLAVRADAVKVCQKARREILEDRIRGAITEALHGGLSAREVKRLVLAQIEALDGHGCGNVLNGTCVLLAGGGWQWTPIPTTGTPACGGSICNAY
jgi:GntR family transcriptional regulator